MKRRTRDWRKHPVAQVVLTAAHGERGLPSELDLDALKLPPAHRRAVASACRHVAAIQATGEQQDARETAAQHVEKLIDLLPTEFRDVDYLREPEPISDNNPRELAARVSRW